MNALSHVFQWMLLAVGLYVVVAAAVWVASAVRFALSRETSAADAFYDIPDDQLPPITVLLPAYCEERTIGAALDALRTVDYPDLEVIAIDDGSGLPPDWQQRPGHHGLRWLHERVAGQGGSLRVQLPAALALNGVSMNASRILGPLIAGAIIAEIGRAHV